MTNVLDLQGMPSVVNPASCVCLSWSSSCKAE